MEPLQVQPLHLKSVTSTNSWALERAESLTHGTLVIADEQTGGRGTQGRSWSSPAGSGVWASLVVSPPKPLVSPAALSIAAGLAVFEATRAFHLSPRLKWPNDLLIDGAKLAGLLVERRGAGPYVCGIGWNVSTTSFPPELEAERRVTSLVRAGAEATIERAQERLIEALELWFPKSWSTPDSLLEPYLTAAGLSLGTQVTALAPEGQELHGRLIAFGFESGLVLDTQKATRSLALEHCRGLFAAS